MNFDIQKIQVQARTRKLNAQWTFEYYKNPYPPFVDYGLCETSCIQKGIVNWDGYTEDIEHYIDHEAVKELTILLQEELKNADN